MGHCTAGTRRAAENSIAIAVSGTHPHSSQNMASDLYWFCWRLWKLQLHFLGAADDAVDLGGELQYRGGPGGDGPKSSWRNRDDLRVAPLLRTQERRYHLAASVALAEIGMLLLGAPRSPLSSVVLLSAVAIGTYSSLPVFISIPGEFLTGFSAAAGIALVSHPSRARAVSWALILLESFDSGLATRPTA